MRSERRQVQGKLEQLLGKIMRAVGRLTGNNKLRAQGAAEQLRGRVREGAGKIGRTSAPSMP